MELGTQVIIRRPAGTVAAAVRDRGTLLACVPGATLTEDGPDAGALEGTHPLEVALGPGGALRLRLDLAVTGADRDQDHAALAISGTAPTAAADHATAQVLLDRLARQVAANVDGVLGEVDAARRQGPAADRPDGVPSHDQPSPDPSTPRRAAGQADPRRRAWLLPIAALVGLGALGWIVRRMRPS